MADYPISPEGTGFREQPTTPITTPEGQAAPSPRRKVYESTLLPERKRYRPPAWLWIGILAVLFALFYGVLYVLPRYRRPVESAGMAVFASDKNSPGRSHLWMVSLTGGAPCELTTGPYSDTEPVFAPDGNKIAFVSDRDNGVKQIFQIDADGRNIQQLTHSSGAKEHPQFDPSDNTLIAFTAAGVLSTVDTVDGTIGRLLPAMNSRDDSADVTTTASMPTTVPSFAWIPAAGNGQPGIAAVEETNGTQSMAILPTLDAAPRETVDGTPQGAPMAPGDQVSLASSPDGSKLAVGILNVRGMPPGKSLSALLLTDTLGHPEQRPVLTVPSDTIGPEDPVFSPDGTQVMFEIVQQPNVASRTTMSLALAPTDYSAPPHVVARGNIADAHFAGAADRIAYLIPGEEKNTDLYVYDNNGSPPVRLSNGAENVTDYSVSGQKPK